MGIRNLHQYLLIERKGRGSALNKTERETTYNILEEYRKTRQSLGYTFDWDDMAMTLNDEFSADQSARLYRHIIIDEGQDFSPEMVKALVAYMPNNGSLTYFADMAQQIYGKSLRWKDYALQPIGGAYTLKENYRSTPEIIAFAQEIAKMPFLKSSRKT